ncbi:MAG: hypothetical protein JWP12_1900 [Bacteroidetes bacterium]|nr:hypothetical protein [Bacteroidota bacterium]
MWNSSIKTFYFFISILLYMFLYSTRSYCATDPVKKIVYDSSKVEARFIPAEKQKELLDDSDYKYDRNGPQPVTFWDRFWSSVRKLIRKMFRSKGGVAGVHIFEYVLMAAAVVLVVVLLLKNNVRALFYGKSAPIAIDFTELKEDIHQINFDELIAEAISRKDFRKAIRLHFLKLLKQLSDKNLIAWQLDKTNIDYSVELSKSQYSSKFKEITFLYEYIWYGDFQINETSYGSMVLKFKEFKIS